METVKKLLTKYREQISYLFFGVLTTAVNFITYAILTQLSLFDGDFGKSTANIIAWFTAVLFAFFTNKFFVFKHKNDSPLLREFFTFFGARVVSGFIENGGFVLFVDVLHFNDFAVKLVIAVVVVVLNYVLSKFLIFKK